MLPSSRQPQEQSDPLVAPPTSTQWDSRRLPVETPADRVRSPRREIEWSVEATDDPWPELSDETSASPAAADDLTPLSMAPEDLRELERLERLHRERLDREQAGVPWSA